MAELSADTTTTVATTVLSGNCLILFTQGSCGQAGHEEVGSNSNFPLNQSIYISIIVQSISNE